MKFVKLNSGKYIQYLHPVTARKQLAADQDAQGQMDALERRINAFIERYNQEQDQHSDHMKTMSSALDTLEARAATSQGTLRGSKPPTVNPSIAAIATNRKPDGALNRGRRV